MLQVFLTLILFANCNQQKSEKEQALEFAQQVIETYFENDCESNYNYWADSVLIMGPFSSKIKFTDKFPSDIEWCKKFNSKQRYNQGYSFTKYLNDYDLKIYNKSEFTNIQFMKENEEDTGISNYLNKTKPQFRDNDYYFSGSHLKEDLSEDKINHQGNWEMIVTKTPNGWEISGTLP